MKRSECSLCDGLDSMFPDDDHDHDRDCIHTCARCGYWGEEVECAGLYHCPNPLCGGPGSSWIARNLPSAKSVGPTSFSVDEEELRSAQLAHVRKLTHGTTLLEHIRKAHPIFVADARGEPYTATYDRDLGDEA